MNTDKTAIIKYSQEFVTPYGTKAWVGFEMPVSADSPYLDDEFKEVLSKVRNWGELATQTSYQGQSSISEIQIKDHDRVNTDAFILNIHHCSDIEALKSYRLILRQYPGAQEAYDQKMKELQSQQ